MDSSVALTGQALYAHHFGVLSIAADWGLAASGSTPPSRPQPGSPFAEGVSIMAWQLSGRSVELCSCKMFCPCWLGPEGQPDQGWCGSALAFDIQRGSSDG